MAKLAFLDHVAIRVADPDKSADWYQNTLGLRRVQPEEWKPVPIMMFAGESGIALFSDADNPTLPACKESMHIAFRVSPEDLAFFRNKLESTGLEVQFQDHLYFHSIYFRDPDGYRLELTAQVKEIGAGS